MSRPNRAPSHLRNSLAVSLGVHLVIGTLTGWLLTWPAPAPAIAPRDEPVRMVYLNLPGPGGGGGGGGNRNAEPPRQLELPGLVETGPLSQPEISRAQLLRPFPQFLDVFNFRPASASSIYHAFQARVEKRFSHGLTFLAADTAGKLIDDCSQAVGFLGPSPTHQDVFIEGVLLTSRSH